MRKSSDSAWRRDREQRLEWWHRGGGARSESNFRRRGRTRVKLRASRQQSCARPTPGLLLNRSLAHQGGRAESKQCRHKGGLWCPWPAGDEGTPWGENAARCKSERPDRRVGRHGESDDHGAACARLVGGSAWGAGGFGASGWGSRGRQSERQEKRSRLARKPVFPGWPRGRSLWRFTYRRRCGCFSAR